MSTLLAIAVHEYSVTILRLALAGVLIVAGIAKLADRAAFLSAVREYRVFPVRSGRIVAIILPWFEVVLGSALLIGFQTRLLAVITTFLFGLFSTVVLANLLRGENHRCHCFGNMHQSQLSWNTLVFDAVLAIIAVHLAVSNTHYLSVDAWLHYGSIQGDGSPSLIGLLLFLLTFLSGFAMAQSFRMIFTLRHGHNS